VATVEEDDIVVDIGTGSSLLALMAGTPRGHEVSLFDKNHFKTIYVYM